FVHLGRLTHGSLKQGDVVELRIDETRRAALRGNHSVTHLLHQALRRRLGEHVTQKGSLVAPDRLRFDFSHPRALSPEDLRAIESEVNARIRQNGAVSTRLMTPQKAVEAGALALFGEKYGDEVRVVAMGDDGEGHGHRHFSVELCGGTHVRRTGDIGYYKIVSESAVAAGVRRIEAVTGAAAEAYVEQEEALLREAAEALRATRSDLPARVLSLIDSGGVGAQKPAAKDVGGIKFAGRAVENVPAKELKSLADDMKKEIGSG